MGQKVNGETEFITAESPASRLDSFLAAHYGQSRSYFAALIEDGHISVNGAAPKKSDKVKTGDRISVTFPPEVLPDISPREMQFDIVYETLRYAIINKPAGVTVHPAPGHYNDSLVNGLLHRFAIADESPDFRPGIVHRLDKDTSGLLIVAKDRRAREVLSSLFSARNIKKKYTAVAWGMAKFKSITVDEPIGRDKIHRKRMCVSPEGRPAKTDITVMEQYKNAFLADILLHTGRTHQIRVHMKHLNHPLLGDELYGGKACAALLHRQALHASAVEFIDPFNDQCVKVEIPLPDSIAELLKKLRGNT